MLEYKSSDQPGKHYSYLFDILIFCCIDFWMDEISSDPPIKKRMTCMIHNGYLYQI